MSAVPLSRSYGRVTRLISGTVFSPIFHLQRLRARATSTQMAARDDRYRLAYRFDLDFNLPGDWYFRFGLFDNYDSQPPQGFSKNDYGWSNSFGFKF